MDGRIGRCVIALSASLAVLGAVVMARAEVPLTINSPNGHLSASVHANAEGRLVADLERDGKPLLASCGLGIVVDGHDLGPQARVASVSGRAIDESRASMGAHATAVDRCVEKTIACEADGTRPAWQLDIRLYDDGFAYRYRVPGAGKRHVDGESGSWTLPPDAIAYFQPPNVRGDYESRFARGRVDELPLLLAPKPTTSPAATQAIRSVLLAPATFKLPNDAGYVMLSEANLIDYSDLALAYVGNAMRPYFLNQPQGWDWTGEIVSPWRVAILAQDLDVLVNSDMVQNLCPPPDAALANAAWVKPGRATWHWMVSGRPKFTDQRGWVDRTCDLGFEYYLIDDGWKQWADAGRDAWACMKDVVDYATTRHVAIWAWVNSNELRDHAARDAYFARAQATGIVGVKIDFMKPADVGWVRWYDDTLRDAAAHHLMIDFHGALKPTGRERTWPNDLTREAVHGREGGKQPALHDAILPFVRYVQGAADYTPTDFRPDKLKGSSYAHELSMAIIFTSPFLCYGGDPQNYLANEAADLIKSIPATWDETRVLPGTTIGERVAFARRRGDAWYVAVLNGKAENGFAIALSFLGPGTYRAEVFGDAPQRNDAWQRREQTVTHASTLQADLRDDGGYVVRLSPMR